MQLSRERNSCIHIVKTEMFNVSLLLLLSSATCSAVCACACLFSLSGYSLLRILSRGERRSAIDPATLISTSNVKILISMLLTSNQLDSVRDKNSV